MPQITIAADRLAIGVPAFERRFQRAFGAVAIPSELHIVTDGTDEAEALDAFDSTLRDHSGRDGFRHARAGAVRDRRPRGRRGDRVELAPVLARVRKGETSR